MERFRFLSSLFSRRRRSEEVRKEDKNHLDVRVVGKVLDHAVAVLHGHGPVQLDALDARLLQAELAQLQHARELAENQALGGWVIFRHQRNLLTLHGGTGGGKTG